MLQTRSGAKAVG